MTGAGDLLFSSRRYRRTKTCQEHQFEVAIVAVVLVRAQNESLAREALICSALKSPSVDEIRSATAEFHKGQDSYRIGRFFD
jgi:hypothetical protein